MLILLSLIILHIRNNQRVQKQWIEQNEQNNWTDLSSKSSPVSSVHPSHCEPPLHNTHNFGDLLFFLFYVYCVCTHVSMQMYECVHGCRGHMSECHPLVTPYFWGEGLSLHLGLSSPNRLSVCRGLALLSALRLQICCWT